MPGDWEMKWFVQSPSWLLVELRSVLRPSDSRAPNLATVLDNWNLPPYIDGAQEGPARWTHACFYVEGTTCSCCQGSFSCELHRTPHLEGSTLGLMLCCHYLEILTTFWARSFFVLGPTNFVACPKKEQRTTLCSSTKPFISLTLPTQSGLSCPLDLWHFYVFIQSSFNILRIIMRRKCAADF